ncbi:MAG: response regulator, partial [Planctomycetes bacterium]|nr:response regulator [Planctomycetota bacterium]
METSKRLLIIDNETNMLRMYKRVFERDGVRIDTAVSAEDALEKVSSNGYDLALIDNGIQPMGGLDFL